MGLYNIPRSEEILEEAKKLKDAGKGEGISQRKLLALKSRSFAIPIAQLYYCNGPEEYDKEGEIQNLYISLRELDCIEDGRLDKEIKLESIDKLIHIYTEVNRPDADLESLIRTDLKNLTATILPGAVDEEEKVFMEQFGYGGAIMALREFKPIGLRSRIVNCMGNMASGMKEFLRKGKVETMKGFEKYCYYVAESVGEALNGIVQIKDNIRSLDYGLARDTGSFLQSTNIAKNLPEDYKEGKNRIIFIPEEFHPGITIEELFNREDEKTKETRKKILGAIIGYAESNFENAVKYAIKIPEHLPGYNAFVTTSVISAKETLKVIKQSDAERVYKGDKTATKMHGETFKNITEFTDKAVRLDNGIRIKDWQVKYSHDPCQFSFKSGEYEKWSAKYLTDEYYSINGNN